MANVNLKPEDVAGKEGDLRAAFKQKHADDISKGIYDQRDIDRLDKDDAYARCFLRTLVSNGDVAKAVGVVNDAFKFRKEMGVWDLTESSFPQELWDMKGLYYQGQDKDGHAILYMKVKLNAPKDKAEGLLLRKFIAYHFEKHHRATPEKMCVVIFDMSGASTSNVSLDITKYVTTCFTQYYPAYLAYLLNYEMPLLLSATWKIISAFLNKDQQKKLIQCSKKDIGKYIPTEHLWEHMK